MRVVEYDRTAAVNYAEQWAFGRNAAYYDFSDLGGDCTSYVSQCLYAGSGIMNYPNWYYRNSYDRSPSWAGVDELYALLVNNQEVGPFATESAPERMEPGDVIQLGRQDGTWYHTLLVVEREPVIYVAAHTNDAFMRPLYSYDFYAARYLHIEGVRVW
ncbi:MAG: amidase domain-containing protein [Clostridia bacterium]|nr:amidase domain-containing protein [Clostridia bacterium]